MFILYNVIVSTTIGRSDTNFHTKKKPSIKIILIKIVGMSE